MKRLDKFDWYEEAMLILEEENFSKITIDNLCSKLNVTKGSFYHHFGNMDGFIDSFMGYIQKIKAINFIEEAEKEPDLEKRLELIRSMGFDSDYGVAHKIRAWSYSDGIVKKHLDQIDKIRLDYLINLRILSGDKEGVAKAKSRIDYALLVGLQQLYSGLPKDELKALYRIYKE